MTNTLEQLLKIAIPVILIGVTIKTAYIIRNEYRLLKQEKDFREYLDKLRRFGL